MFEACDKWDHLVQTFRYGALKYITEVSLYIKIQQRDLDKFIAFGITRYLSLLQKISNQNLLKKTKGTPFVHVEMHV